MGGSFLLRIVWKQAKLITVFLKVSDVSHRAVYNDYMPLFKITDMQLYVLKKHR